MHEQPDVPAREHGQPLHDRAVHDARIVNYPGGPQFGRDRMLHRLLLGLDAGQVGPQTHLGGQNLYTGEHLKDPKAVQCGG